MLVTPPFQLVAVTWDDASTEHGWEHADEADTSRELVITVGFLYREDERYLYLCSTCDSGRNTNSRIKIPVGMVVERAPVVMTKRKSATRRGKDADATKPTTDP